MEEKPMKTKTVIVLLFITLLFVSGCSNKKDDHPMELRGEYKYGECVYLTVLSSSTCGLFELENGKYFDFSETTLKEYNTLGELEHDYQNITYSLVPVDLNLDVNNDPLDLFIPKEFLENAKYRFDIYNNDNSIQYSIFESENKFYIAETRMLNSSIDNFTIWSIYELIVK